MKEKECSYRANWNWIIFSVVIVAVCTLLLVYYPPIYDFDWMVLKYIRGFLEPYPSFLPLFFSEFGRDYMMFWPQFAACCALISCQKYIKAFLLVFFTQAAYAATYAIKEFVCRERPCGDAYPGFSYPSCHASTMTCLLGIFAYLILHYVRNKFWRYFLATFIILYLIMVCISRMWLSHHFPVDVLAGTFLGVIMLNLYIISCKFFGRQ